MQTKETVTITKIFTTDKNKDGSPLMSKTKQPYTRMSIQTQEFGAVWLSGFKGKESGAWKEGDKVDILLKKSPNPKGGEYLNFDVPKLEDKVNGEIEKIHNLLTGMNIILMQIAEKVGVNVYQASKVGNTEMDYPDGPNAEEIPF